MAAILATLLASCGEAPAPFEITWGGDLLLGDAATPLLEEHGYQWPFERIADLLEADYSIANQEAPITDRVEPFFPDQRFSYNADPDAAGALAEAGFDAVGLSNNHALDRGPEGLRDTVAHLQRAGVIPFGAGTLADAEAPLVIETPHGTVAVLAFGNAWRYGAVAGPTEVGTLPISEATLERGRLLARDTGADWTIAFVHWGENYSDVTDDQRDAARLMAEAGYDLVIGHHPHVVQEVEVIGRTPVLYSIGNLVFGTPGRFTEDAEGYGLIVRTAFGADGSLDITLRCIVTDNDLVDFQPEPCATAEAQRLFSRLGPAIRVEDDTGVVDTGR